MTLGRLKKLFTRPKEEQGESVPIIKGYSWYHVKVPCLCDETYRWVAIKPPTCESCLKKKSEG